ncbi:copper-binding protein [Variovorax sp. J22P240]|uniref:copper-binding protein n=1 Tax=Variovorax sp. J22P240 TaxID=3053514 RepID=UPI002578AE42|nr:copper-binding protein [Variovorax sp. J22P240]MDM0002015.1 copper-binding protein [Variovorax sp. J22P240]
MLGFRNSLLAGVVALAGLAHAQSATDELSNGEVRKVDKENARITLKHGPLNNLEMPGMTMVFKVSDNALLDTVQTGDKVRFRAEMVDGKIVVTKLEATR